MSTTPASARDAALAAARAGGYAPSIHNSQPWRWRISGETLQLLADRRRQLDITDPGGRMLTISCGAALHHALVALAANGWHAEVRLVPEAADPDLLATVRPSGRLGEDAITNAAAKLQLLRVRHTDRRPVADSPVPEDAIAAVTEAASAEGARLHWLGPAEVIELASAADHAQEAERVDEGWRAELTYWVNAGEGLGVPREAIPAEAPATTVPARNFTQPGTLPIGPGHDTYARYAVLYGDEDTVQGWLRGGAALSAAWIQSLAHGLTLVPLSAVVEVPATRQKLRHLLSELGEPYLAIRVGIAPTDLGEPGPTPRLAAEQLIETVE